MQYKRAKVPCIRIIAQAQAQLKQGKWFVTICAPLSPSLALLSACILGPDSQREIQFLLTAPCCPDRIYHLELELQPERQCTVDTSWTAPVTTLTITHTHTHTHTDTHTHTHTHTHIHRHADMLTHRYGQTCSNCKGIHVTTTVVNEAFRSFIWEKTVCLHNFKWKYTRINTKCI